MLNQLKCHILLNGKKLGLTTPFSQNLPVDIEVEPYLESMDSFEQDIASSLQENNILNPKLLDFYQSITSSNLEDKKLRQVLFLNSSSQVFTDTHQLNAFIRLRRDHLHKLGHENIIQNEID